MHFVGGSMTLADVQFFMMIESLQMFGLHYEGYKVITQFMNEKKSNPSMKKASETMLSYVPIFKDWALKD